MLPLSRGDEPQGVLLHTTDGGDSWKVAFTARDDLYHVGFLGGKRGWLAGGRGALWTCTDTAPTWLPRPTPADVAPSCLAVAPHGAPFALAPLWQGRVLLTTGAEWQEVRVPLAYAMPSAAVVDAGRAYVLGADGRIARYADPSVAAK
jgi:photosystem II stability/assembly factor-like uncharacterized protein